MLEFYVQGFEDSIPKKLIATDRASAIIEASAYEDYDTINEIDDGVCFSIYYFDSEKWRGKYTVDDAIAIQHKLDAVNSRSDNIDHVCHLASEIDVMSMRAVSIMRISRLTTDDMIGVQVIASSVGEISKSREGRTITEVHLERTPEGWIVNAIEIVTLEANEPGYLFIYLAERQRDLIQKRALMGYEILV